MNKFISAFAAVVFLAGCMEGDKFSDDGYVIVHAGKINLSGTRYFVTFENVGEGNDIDVKVEARSKYHNEPELVSEFFHFKGIGSTLETRQGEAFFISSSDQVRNKPAQAHKIDSGDETSGRDDERTVEFRFRVASNRDLKLENRQIKTLAKAYNVDPQDILVGLGPLSIYQERRMSTRSAGCRPSGRGMAGCYLIPIGGQCTWDKRWSC